MQKRLCSCGNPLPSRKKIICDWFTMDVKDRGFLICEHCKKRYVPTGAQRVLLFLLVFAFSTAYVTLLRGASLWVRLPVLLLIPVVLVAPYALLPWKEASAERPLKPVMELLISLAIVVPALLCSFAVYFIIY